MAARINEPNHKRKSPLDLAAQRASWLMAQGRWLRRASRAARRRRGRDGAGRRLGNLRARRRARLRQKAALERAIDAAFDRRRRFAHHFGDFRDDEELGAIEHALLAEREALRLGEERQALEDVGDFVDRAAAHLVGVVLEASLPVLMVVDLAVAEQAEQPLDFLVADRAAEADAVDVTQGNQYGRLIRDDAEMIKAAGRPEDSLLFDAFD